MTQFLLQCRLSLELEAAIDRQTDAVDGASLIAGQPDVGVGDVLGVNQSSQGCVADEVVQYLVGYRFDHRRLGEAGQNRVGADAKFTKIPGTGFHQGNQGLLADTIVGLAHVAGYRHETRGK